DILRGKLWREMERCFRAMLPEEIDRRKKARRMTLIAMLGLPPSWSKATAAQEAMGLGVELGTLILLKKIACFAVASLFAVLGIVIVVDPLGWRRPEDNAADRATPTPPVASPSAQLILKEPEDPPRLAIGVKNPEAPAIAGAVFLESEGGAI